MVVQARRSSFLSLPDADGFMYDDASSSSGSENRSTELLVTEAEGNAIKVRTYRPIVLGSIFSLAVLCATLTFWFIGEHEEDQSASTVGYDAFLHSIEESLEGRLKSIFDASQGLAGSITIAAAEQNSSFPFVTVPFFEAKAQQAREQSGIESFSYCPIITEENRFQWSSYAMDNKGWIENSRAASGGESESEAEIHPFLWTISDGYKVVESAGNGPFASLWQTSPLPLNPLASINYEMLSDPEFSRTLLVLSLTGEAVFGSFRNLFGYKGAPITGSDYELEHESGGKHAIRPHSVLYQPVFAQLAGSTEKDLAGVLISIIAWDSLLANLIPEGVTGFVAVIENTCDQAYTYALDGDKLLFLGEGNHYDAASDSSTHVVDLSGYQTDLTATVSGHCQYSLSLHLSPTEQSDSNLPLICTIAVGVIFFVVAVFFLIYDGIVQRMNDKVAKTAARSNAILSSLFPSTVRDRLFAEKDETHALVSPGSDNARLKSFLAGGSSDELKFDLEESNIISFKTKPIADLFPETTILFADIAGFTAWSSVREPGHVFILLETLYHAYDEIAKKRRVFKVETVGDCYVAVAGLPDPQKDHAVVMARFARDCLHKTKDLTKRLEVVLGPDTCDLTMRMGLHSGPVTAGVLRGARSRFQLFGDTVNTAARMESTGLPDRIQISQETADLLVSAGKADWVRMREDKIVAKGKGEMQTYWVSLGSSRDRESTAANMSTATDDTDRMDSMDSGSDEMFGKTSRLIDWNVDVISRVLKQIVAHRRASRAALQSSHSIRERAPPDERLFKLRGGSCLDEVQEIITLPSFNPKVAECEEDPDEIVLDDEVIDQLHDYVSNVAAMYRDNPFHNFEHASHVTMSVVKLMSRIVAPSDIDFEDSYTLHDHTYGITSDPLTQFACIFSALIHDVDHSGVPNSQLVREGSKLAQHYNDKSVAEQNSVDLAWRLLMDDNYYELRSVIYTTDAELYRFRQLVVNSVMATDIVDRELKTLRNMRWERAFSAHLYKPYDNDENDDENDESHNKIVQEDINRKATVVIEHLIQASDVAHTMQHWHVYRKWNERLFMECHKAYYNGQADKDPSTFWYQGELDFFDYYIIPLAKKLKDCGVFGVSSDEYLNYAERNRKEWEERGRQVVTEMVEHVCVEEMKREDEMALKPPARRRSFVADPA